MGILPRPDFDKNWYDFIGFYIFNVIKIQILNDKMAFEIYYDLNFLRGLSSLSIIIIFSRFLTSSGNDVLP